MVSRASDPTSLFKMQEYVSRLSVDQLKNEIQNNTGSVPSWMLISALQDKLRANASGMQAQKPSSTVASDLIRRTSEPQQAGIGSLVPREEAPEPQAMAHGGIVHMEGGGEPSISDEPPTISDEMRKKIQDDIRKQESYNKYGIGPIYGMLGMSGGAFEAPAMYLGEALRDNRSYKNTLPAPTTRSRVSQEIAASSGFSEEPYPNSNAALIQSQLGGAYTQQTGGQSAQQQSAPGDYPQASQEPPISPSASPAAQDSAELPIPPNPPAGGAPPRGPGIRSLPGGGGASGGLGGAGGGGAGGLPSGAGEAPTGPLQDAINRMRLSDERVQKLSELATKGPTTQERRQEAINMALLQAGLGMMQPGQSNALAAISRGAMPALQQLGENFRYIRKEDQDNIMNQLKIENQSALNAFHQGTIGYHIYDTQVKENIARANQAAHLAAASITAGGRQAAQQATNAFRDLQIGTRQFGTMNALASKEDASAAALRKEIIAIQNNQMDSPERKKAISDREALIKQHTDMASQYRINGYLIGQRHGIVPELTIDRGNQNNTSTNLPFAQED